MPLEAHLTEQWELTSPDFIQSLDSRLHVESLERAEA